MNKFDMPTMEGEIQKEEHAGSSKTNLTSNNNPITKFNLLNQKHNVTKITKNTKLIAVFMLFFIFILICVGLIVLSSKKDAPPDVQTGIVITSPEPQNVAKNPEIKEIENKLDLYDDKVDSLENNLGNYQPPQIDLNVTF